MRIIPIRRLNMRGDTLLEVLIAVAILSLILTTAFALANRSTLANRQAAERGEANKAAQAEVEKLKYYLSLPGLEMPDNASFFCINYSDATDPTVLPIDNITLGTIETDYNNIPTECRQGIDQRYAVMTYRGAANSTERDTYTTYVRWDSITGNGSDKISIINKLYQDEAGGPDIFFCTGASCDAPNTIPVITFSASSSTVNVGSPLTLTWSVTNNPTECTATGAWTGPRSTASPSSFTIPATTFSSAGQYIFRIQCVNAKGEIGSASLTVNAIVPPINVTIYAAADCYRPNPADQPEACPWMSTTFHWNNGTSDTPPNTLVSHPYAPTNAQRLSNPVGSFRPYTFEFNKPAGFTLSHISVQMVRDAWGGTLATDRNLYVGNYTVNGTPYRAFNTGSCVRSTENYTYFIGNDAQWHCSTATVNYFRDMFIRNGRDYSQCAKLPEAGSNPAFDCVSSSLNTVYSCQNFEARYSLTNIRPGARTLILDYGDRNCGSPTPPDSSGYRFSVDIYVNGLFRRNVQLIPSGNTVEIDLGTAVQSSDTISIAWKNNVWVSDGSNPNAYDPDFEIYRIGVR